MNKLIFRLMHISRFISDIQAQYGTIYTDPKYIYLLVPSRKKQPKNFEQLRISLRAQKSRKECPH